MAHIEDWPRAPAPEGKEDDDSCALIPGLPDNLTVTEILPRLPLWKADHLRAVSSYWRNTIQSSLEYVLRIRASRGLTQRFLLLCNVHYASYVDASGVKRTQVGTRELEFVLLDIMYGAEIFVPKILVRGNSHFIHTQGCNIFVLTDINKHPDFLETEASYLHTFNLHKNKWRQCRIRNRAQWAMEFWEDSRYVADGYLFTVHKRYVNRLNIGECSMETQSKNLDIDADAIEWEKMPLLTIERFNAIIRVADKKLYVLGGLCISDDVLFEEIFSGEVLELHGNAKEWSLVPELYPKAIFGEEISTPIVEVLQGHLCALCKESERILCYDPTCKVWKPWLCIAGLKERLFQSPLLLSIHEDMLSIIVLSYDAVKHPLHNVKTSYESLEVTYIEEGTDDVMNYGSVSTSHEFEVQTYNENQREDCVLVLTLPTKRSQLAHSSRESILTLTSRKTKLVQSSTPGIQIASYFLHQSRLHTGRLISI
ncbi:hypothetical protein KP509_12G056800 [Ceratopteris richardii]|uniref:F-box domain-containing protein n=1 Tax=Ceratopteris richardii TaxID=49495 RepID=A0A8T2TLA3_CERRI|nr:hypothetical protein KP509_12G056800 [Ceratopteris richardii]